MQTETIAISFKDVSYSYAASDNSPKVLDGLSFEIPQGQFVAILGRNGSGKSTLAKHINALLLPDSGDVEVFGLNTKDEKNTKEIRTATGMVLQDPESQIVATIVADDVAFGPENLGLERSEIAKRVDDSLKRVELFEKKDFNTSALSGGQKRRLSIASVLAMNPKIIIFDEPASMLDPKGRKEILNIILDLKNHGTTVVLITHFPDDAMLADRVIVLNQGMIAIDANPEEAFKNAKLIESMYLELPSTGKLSQKLAELGVNVEPTLDEKHLLNEIKCLLSASKNGGGKADVD